VHLVGFIIRIYHDAQSSECHIPNSDPKFHHPLIVDSAGRSTRVLCCIVDGYCCCVVDRHCFFFLQDCGMYCM